MICGTFLPSSHKKAICSSPSQWTFLIRSRSLAVDLVKRRATMCAFAAASREAVLPESNSTQLPLRLTSPPIRTMRYLFPLGEMSKGPVPDVSKTRVASMESVTVKGRFVASPQQRHGHKAKQTSVGTIIQSRAITLFSSIPRVFLRGTV